MSSAERWDTRYAAAQALTAPAPVLQENLHLLPTTGNALDLAGGISGNALLLASHGLATSVWDCSAVALTLQQKEAQRAGLSVVTEQRDCEQHPPEAETFDVICVAHFLHRPSCPALVDALKPGGVVFYQTFTREKLSAEGPSSNHFLLQPGELLSLFSGLTVHYYRENGLCGKLKQGDRNRACYIGSKAG
jgi:tellurite methyltransferase